MTKEAVMIEDTRPNTRPEPEFAVQAGIQLLKFDGIKLASSSSQFGRKPRWVEFELYRTTRGDYIVSRVGYSLFYHAADCYTVTRNNLEPVDGLSLSSAYIPCPKCKPNLTPDGVLPRTPHGAPQGVPDEVYPETPRRAGWRCFEASGVVNSLMKEDDNGTEYLTNVARRLLVEAAKLDRNISDAFYVVRID
ncbi:hypothetical protein SEA_ATUIN_91 [Arthrobacter phage Atuin]|nr:hypothetical protein SEA_ATUIN_190 [Arthrobacter phage Atuin]